MRSEEADRGQVDGAVGEQVEDDGEAPDRPCRLDAVPRRRVGEPEDLGQVAEEPPRTLAAMKPAAGDLDEVSESPAAMVRQFVFMPDCLAPALDTIFSGLQMTPGRTRRGRSSARDTRGRDCATRWITLSQRGLLISG